MLFRSVNVSCVLNYSWFGGCYLMSRICYVYVQISLIISVFVALTCCYYFWSWNSAVQGKCWKQLLQKFCRCSPVKSQTACYMCLLPLGHYLYCCLRLSHGFSLTGTCLSRVQAKTKRLLRAQPSIAPSDPCTSVSSVRNRRLNRTIGAPISRLEIGRASCRERVSRRV